MAKRVLFQESLGLNEAESAELSALAAELNHLAPLTPKTAYLEAREEIGGELYVEAKREVERLSKLDNTAARALNDHLENRERARLIGKILPRNTLTLRRLFETHRRARLAYNDAARRLEAKLNHLRSPEMREQIAKRTKELLAADIAKREHLSRYSRQVENLVAQASKVQKLTPKPAPKVLPKPKL